jgi:hypothetical protein
VSDSAKYALTGATGVTLVTLGLWPFLEPAGRRGILIAAAVALPIQVIAFSLMLRYRQDWNRFLAIWAGGTLLRMAVVGVVAFIAIRTGTEGAIPMLLALAGYFFGLLLLEPMFFKLHNGETA